jgi:hypothetical protein
LFDFGFRNADFGFHQSYSTLGINKNPTIPEFLNPKFIDLS